MRKSDNSNITVGYIYVIVNNINDKKYVGKTTLDIQKRFKQHCNEYKRDRCKNRPLYKAMLKYGIENFSVDLLKVCNIEDLSKYESYYINELNTYGHNGYNATKGGDGTVLYNYKEILELYNSGLNMRQIAKQLYCCVDTISKVINNSDVIKHKQYNGFCFQPVEIYQCDKETNQSIQKFSSINGAVKWLSEHGIMHNYNSNRSGACSKISQCCKGISMTAYGYKWKYVEEKNT